MRFVLIAWLVSRAIVIAAMAFTGVHVVAALGNWDGAWYGSIAEHGYSYAADGTQHNLAFFPLFPLLGALAMRSGLSWPLAGALVDAVAFFGALVFLRALALRCFDERTADWCVAAACALPLSLFSSVAYAQGCFMCASAAALYYCSLRRPLPAGVAGACATASAALGIPLVIAMVVEAVRTRDRAAFAGAALASCGIGAFAAFCAWKFGDPFAFVQAQHAWRHGFGFDAGSWQRIAGSLLAWDGLRANVMTLLVPAGALAMLLFARKLGALMTLYGLLALGVLAFAGTPFSVDRNAYTIVPVLLALGATFRRVPALGYIVIAGSLVLLVIDAARFARFEWVA